MSRLTQPASTTSATWTRRSYQSLDATSLTIGGGAAQIFLRGSSAKFVYGESHVDLGPQYIALAFGSRYNIMVDSGGVHINGSTGSKTF